MNLEEIKKKELYYNQKIREFYEEYAKNFIGKFYKQEHKKEDNLHGDRDYTKYLYIHGVSNRSLSAIEFRASTITRVGIWIDHDGLQGWLEISYVEFEEGLKEYLKFFHLDKILEVKT